MAGLMQLKKRAKALGMSGADVRGADRDELETFIANANGSKSKKVAKKKVSKAVAKKSAPAKKRGRPKGSTTKAKSTKKISKSSGATGNGHTRSTDGRHILSGIDYGKEKGWNPRKGSPPDRIIRALKRFKGNRTKVFDHLKGDVFDFTSRKKQDGSKRNKAEAEQMLKYRISRTAWQFALATKQHKTASKRIEYGTGENATTRKKGKRGRPAGSAKSTSKAKTTGKKRGRPKGSKNKK